MVHTLDGEVVPRMLAGAEKDLHGAKDRALAEEQDLLAGVLLVDDVKDVGAVGDDHTPGGAAGGSGEHIVFQLAGDEGGVLVDLLEGLVLPAGVVDTVKLVDLEGLKLLGVGHDDLLGVDHAGDGTVESHVEVVLVQLLGLLLGDLNALLGKAAVVGGVAHELVLGHGQSLGVADQMDGLALQLGNGGTLDVVDLTGVLVDINAPLEETGGNMHSFGYGNGVDVKHGHLFPFLCLAVCFLNYLDFIRALTLSVRLFSMM